MRYTAESHTSVYTTRVTKPYQKIKATISTLNNHNNHRLSHPTIKRTQAIFLILSELVKFFIAVVHEK